jgi:hypothetical protein
MPNIKIGRMALALPLLFGLLMVAGGYQIVREWASESNALILTGVLISICGTTMIFSAIWLLATLGRSRFPLWTGGFASLICAAVVSISTLCHVLPCSGPA